MYYQGQPVYLEVVPELIVVSSPLPTAAENARETLNTLGLQVVGARRLTQASGHWLLELPPDISPQAAAIAQESLRSDARFDFASTAFKILGGTRPMLPLNRVGVRFRDGVPRRQIDSLIYATGTSVVREPRPDSGFQEFWIAYPKGVSSDPLSVAATYYRHPFVEYAHPDMVNDVGPAFVPTDPYYSEQYYLKNATFFNGVRVDINVERAWDVELTKGCGIPSGGCQAVAVIDDGVQASHPDFNGHVNFGYHVFGNNTFGCTQCAWNPSNDPSHGTLVAGIILGQHNSQGIAGIAPGVYIVPVRIFRPLVEGGPASDLQLADGINFAWNLAAAAVLSNSWGYLDPTYEGNQPVTNAINNATTQGRSGKGAVVVFSAGNTSQRDFNQIGGVQYPAKLSNVLAVGAIDRFGSLTDYTPEGPQLDVVAPSGHYTGTCIGDIVTTDLVGSRGCNDGPSGEIDYSSTFSGTSAAAPQVAGVAALLLAKEPSLTESVARGRITQNANPWGPANQFGAGKLNAYATLVGPPPSVAIGGPSAVRRRVPCTWSAIVSGGTPPYVYGWTVNNLPVGGNSPELVVPPSLSVSQSPTI
ncbi:MAG: S8 family peptidase [Gemmatimonadales bacterium]